MLKDRMIAALRSAPNRMMSRFCLMNEMYPDYAPGDPANGARMSSVTKIARRHPEFQMVDAETIALSQ